MRAIVILKNPTDIKNLEYGMSEKEITKYTDYPIRCLHRVHGILDVDVDNGFDERDLEHAIDVLTKMLNEQKLKTIWWYK